ncbi:unnamed protein product [marine sediment metagenome]|uniref:Uncharacterized protein n=1 Tax=marine sediment metagenome TaxID=412755 RepID=X1C7T2_9ZZZZ
MNSFEIVHILNPANGETRYRVDRDGVEEQTFGSNAVASLYCEAREQDFSPHAAYSYATRNLQVIEEAVAAA